MSQSTPSPSILFVAALLVEGLRTQGWTPHLAPIAPSPRSNSRLAYDPLRDRVVLFGGWDGNRHLDDTWEYDGTSWSSPQPALRPAARHAHLLVFDPVSGRTLLFGGVAASALDDTWLWDGANWTIPSTAVSRPSPRFEMGAAYFPPAHAIVTYGGQTGSFTFHADMWSWNGSSWAQLPTLPQWPGRRSQMGFVYDPTRRRLVLAGGHSYAPRLFHADTWEYDGTAWTQSSATFPTPRSDMAMGFVPSTGTIVLFGGYTDATPLGDCWSFDGTAWTALAGGPGAREHVSAVTDDARGRIVLFGGSARTHVLGDTWSYGDAVAPTFVLHDAGCGPGGVVPVLTAVAPPWQGAFFQVDMNVPPTMLLPTLAFGATATTPFDLGALGAAGCRVFVDVGSPFALEPMTTSGGHASWSRMVPPGLAGFPFEVQGLLVAPGANALGVALTRGGSGVVR